MGTDMIDLKPIRGEGYTEILPNGFYRIVWWNPDFQVYVTADGAYPKEEAEARLAKQIQKMKDTYRKPSRVSNTRK